MVDTNVFKKIVANRTVDDYYDYIVVYALEDASRDSSKLIAQVKRLKERYKKEVLVICGPRKWPFPVKQIRGICPEEFLYYIDHAFCVVNNSFHATVFSILFRKQFVTMGFQSRSVRMLELLRETGLESRYCSENNDAVTIMEEKIDYSKHEKELERLRKIGSNYLDTQIWLATK